MPDKTDVLLLTALKEERDAVLAVAPDGWKPLIDNRGFKHCTCTLATAGGRLRLVLAYATDMGGESTAILATRLIGELSPRCLAMCGVCAGRPGDIALGDVAFANCTFAFDYGKLKSGEGGASVFESDLRTRIPDPRWIQAARELDPCRLSCWAAADAQAQRLWILERLAYGDNPRKHPGRTSMFPGDTWSQQVRALLEAGEVVAQGQVLRLSPTGQEVWDRHALLSPGGPERLPFTVHVGPMASSNAVVADPAVWEGIAAYQRKVLAIDMEAAAIGKVAHLEPVQYFAVAKGVMDHADGRKNNHYKTFAARASADVMLYFLKAQLAGAADRPPDLKPLQSFLSSAFSAPELATFLRDGPQGKQLAQALRGSPESDVETAVQVLSEQGLIDAALFVRLRQKRPHRVSEIDEAQTQVLGADRVRQHGDPTNIVAVETRKPASEQRRSTIVGYYGSKPSGLGQLIHSIRPADRVRPPIRQTCYSCA